MSFTPAFYLQFTRLFINNRAPAVERGAAATVLNYLTNLGGH